MTCPRMVESGVEKEAHWHEDDTCSYCGSLSPSAFFAAIEQGCELGPTDKNYKVYIDLIEEHPDELKLVGTSNAVEQPGPNWAKSENGWELWQKRGPNKFGKFYFQHFNKEECIKFIHLLNSKKLKIGYPGHFYVLPFFIATRQKVL